jgi:histidyl-tRNA synthetase
LFLSDAAREFYERLQRDLRGFGVPFVQNPNIVRGLDYYNHTAFEFVTDALGAQGTVMGGGRYDGLVEMMGGPKVPGIGWGAGIDRLAMLLAVPPAAKPAVIVIGEDRAIEVAGFLRAQGVATEISFQSGLKNGLKYANRVRAKWAVLANADGLVLKNLEDGSQVDVTLDGLQDSLL